VNWLMAIYTRVVILQLRGWSRIECFLECCNEGIVVIVVVVPPLIYSSVNGRYTRTSVALS